MSQGHRCKLSWRALVVPTAGAVLCMGFAACGAQRRVAPARLATKRPSDLREEPRPGPIRSEEERVVSSGAAVVTARYGNQIAAWRRRYSESSGDAVGPAWSAHRTGPRRWSVSLQLKTRTKPEKAIGPYALWSTPGPLDRRPTPHEMRVLSSRHAVRPANSGALHYARFPPVRLHNGRTGPSEVELRGLADRSVASLGSLAVAYYGRRQQLSFLAVSGGASRIQRGAQVIGAQARSAVLRTDQRTRVYLARSGGGSPRRINVPLAVRIIRESPVVEVTVDWSIARKRFAAQTALPARRISLRIIS